MRRDDAELAPTLDAIIRAGVDTIGPADYAGLVMFRNKSVEAVATAGEPVTRLDEWQRMGGVDPYIDVATSAADGTRRRPV